MISPVLGSIISSLITLPIKFSAAFVFGPGVDILSDPRNFSKTSPLSPKPIACNHIDIGNFLLLSKLIVIILL